MSELHKMLTGHLYNALDAELIQQRATAHHLSTAYSATYEEETTKRQAIIDQLFPDHAAGVALQGPIFLDYGRYTHLGENFYANANLTILDCGPVTIGRNVKFGPNVSLVTPVHPLRYQERNLRHFTDGTPYDQEYAKPITIGANCWLASNVTVIGGVTIGAGCVIGAGSVVTRDIPANSLAVGNPCRVLRTITDQDRMTPVVPD